jgi:DNA modification methylase
MTVRIADVIRADALTVLRSMETASVDAIVTDPPYCAGAVSEAQRTRAAGQGLRSENIRRFGWFTGDNMGTAGLVWLLREMAFEATRVVRPTGSVVVFCDWRMLSALQPAIESAGLRYQNLVVWDKGSMGLGLGFRAQHELAMRFGVTDPEHPDPEAFGMHFTLGDPEYHDKGTGNVLRAGRVRADDREHQTQKPVELMRQIVRVVCPPGGCVVDPFCGSGSTGVAAVLEGREFFGADRDPEHVETARRRIAEARGKFSPTDPQQTLFGDAA